MKAGKLRHKIIIEEPTETQDAYGQPVKTWTTFKTRRASYNNLSGNEKFVSQQVNSESKVAFTVRHITGVTTKMRIYFDSRYFNILYVNDINGIDKMLRIECEEQT